MSGHPYGLPLRRGPSKGRGLRDFTWPGPRISREVRPWGIQGPLSYFYVFSSRRFSEYGLIGKHHLLRPLLQELRSLRQITPLISAWRVGRGMARSDEPRSNDKDLEALASAGVSKYNARGTLGVCKGNFTTWSPRPCRGLSGRTPWMPRSLGLASAPDSLGDLEQVRGPLWASFSPSTWMRVGVFKVASLGPQGSLE